MLPLIASGLWAATVTYLLLRAVRQYSGYQRVELCEDDLDQAQSLTVIIPARNEAGNIGKCLSGLLAQEYPHERLKIIIVDDNSADGTADVVRTVAGDDERVELIHAGSLPEGWMGKPHACQVGADRADSTWLCFIDADTTSHPALLRRAETEARHRGIDMLSLEPFQELGSFWERLLLPTGFFAMAFTQDVRRVNDPNFPDAMANGQFILVRRDVYESVGGHAAVRNEICEDTALAQKVKGAGYRIALMGAEMLMRARMYTGLKSLWEGLSKNATQTIGGSGKTVVAAVGGVVLATATPLAPIWAWLGAESPAHRVPAIILSGGASLAMFATHISACGYFRIPRWYGMLFPLGYLIGAALALHAVWKRARGRVSWKGRAYSPAPAGAP